MEHPFETAIKAKEETNFSGSANTVRDRVQNFEMQRRAANKIFLTERNKQDRLEFAH